jgi:hypothetical protein
VLPPASSLPEFKSVLKAVVLGVLNEFKRIFF